MRADVRNNIQAEVALYLTWEEATDLIEAALRRSESGTPEPFRHLAKRLYATMLLGRPHVGWWVPGEHQWGVEREGLCTCQGCFLVMKVERPPTWEEALAPLCRG